MNDIISRPVGFIGLGNMGWPMAANLARSGRTLIVRDADVSRQQGFVAEFGAVPAGDPSAFSGVDALVTMLPNGKIVRDVLMEWGVAKALPKRALVVDCSSSDPFGTLKLGAELAELGILLVDAPVSGGMVKAIDGTLSIMLGTEDEGIAERAIVVLEAMSARIFRTGGLGTGHAMKAINNFVLGAGFVAAAEALVMGGKFGLDPATVVDVLNASSGRNLSTETTFVSEILPRRFAANFTLALFSKDLGIAADLAGKLGIDAPLCQTVYARLAEAGAELGWQNDYTKALTLWERQAGIELPAR